MKYPIQTHDLVAIDAQNDEEATLIVIEAILNSTLNELEFISSIERTEVENRLREWEYFDTYVDIILTQKSMLRSPINGHSISLNDLDYSQPNLTHEMISKAASAYKPRKRERTTRRLYIASSVAASIFIFTFAFSLVVKGYDSPQLTQSYNVAMETNTTPTPNQSTPEAKTEKSGNSLDSVDPKQLTSDSDTSKTASGQEQLSRTDKNPSQSKVSVKSNTDTKFRSYLRFILYLIATISLIVSVITIALAIRTRRNAT